ncbi:hypothetical protein HAX54_021908, partial [Datura stramonium]|nr:hypothetical protein [Datura stramonium]
QIRDEILQCENRDDKCPGNIFEKRGVRNVQNGLVHFNGRKMGLQRDVLRVYGCRAAEFWRSLGAVISRANLNMTEEESKNTSEGMHMLRNYCKHSMLLMLKYRKIHVKLLIGGVSRQEEHHTHWLWERLAAGTRTKKLKPVIPLISSLIRNARGIGTLGALETKLSSKSTN